MSIAGNKTEEKNPTLSHKLFGFKPTGEDVTIPLSSVYDLLGKAASGITNQYNLSESFLAQGSFVPNSLVFDEITEITFNNKDHYGVDMVAFFTLLNANKADLFLKIKKLGVETVGYFKILGISFNANDLTLGVALYENLKIGVLALEDNVYLEPVMERSPDFTDTQLNRLKDSVYEAIIQSISVLPTTFEKGLATNLVYTWNVNRRDDTLNTCTLDGLDKILEATGINRTHNVANQVATKTVSLVTNVNRNDVSGGSFTTSSQATSTEIVPQYFGLVASAAVPPLTYELLNPDPNTKIKKWLSTVSAKTVVLGTDLPTPVNEKVFFLSTNANATIYNGSGFDVTSAFTKTTVTMKLANGADQTITQYLLTIPVSSTGTYTIN